MSDRGRGRGGGGGGRGGGGRGGGAAGGGNLAHRPRGGAGFSGPRGGQGGQGGGYRGGGGGGRGGGPVTNERGGEPGGKPPFKPNAELFQHGAPTIDSSVTKAEDAIVQKTKTYLDGKPKDLVAVHPPRPSYGTKGAPVTLWANYFSVAVEDVTLYRYAVDIARQASPKPSPKRLKEMVKLLIKDKLMQHESSLATDFNSTIFSLKNLDKELDRKEFFVPYRSEGADPPTDQDPGYTSKDKDRNLYRFRIQATGTISTSELLRYLSRTEPTLWSDRQAQVIQALNIIVGHRPKWLASIANTGSGKYFDLRAADSDRHNLGGGLEAIRGYFVSVRPATGRVLLNIQVKNGAFYHAGPLVQLMRRFAAQPNQHIESLSRFLKKVNIDAIHIKKTNKSGQRIPNIRTILDVARQRKDGKGKGVTNNPPRIQHDGAGPEGVMFYLEEQKKYITVGEFFRTNHGISSDKSMPVVNVGSHERPIYLIAEVCRVLEGQPVRAKLEPSQTASMIAFAVRRPHLNAQSIVTTGRNMINSDDARLTSFGLKVASRLTAVPGRVLTAPALRYAGKGKPLVPRFGSWNLSENKLVDGSALKTWSWLRVKRSNERRLTTTEDVTEAMKPFTKTLNDSGLRVTQPLPGAIVDVDQNNYASVIDNIIGRMKNSPKGIRFLVIVLPEKNNTGLYNECKKACDVKHGLLNLCVQDFKFMKQSVDTYANVALKMNLKLGGKNHYADPSRLPIVSEGKTMLIGLDVTHPSPGSQSAAPSVAAIVASVDRELAQWPAAISILPPRQEMVRDALVEMVKSRLALWQKNNNQSLPENIIVYRDGVSEGQYDSVLQQELPQIREACSKVYPANQTKANLPKIAVVIVGKRHHTRAFCVDQAKMDRSGNPQNGTVVDRGITQAWLWDFYLQAHTAIQGTARSAHYYVIYDQIFRERQRGSILAADLLEDLTHSMCYLFGRATKAVSVCPPAYYADIVAERARCYLHNLFDPDVSDTASVASSQQSTNANNITIHPNVADAMFYT